MFYQTVNLAQIRSAVPDIFQTQTKKTQSDGAKNGTFCSSLRAVKTDAAAKANILYLKIKTSSEFNPF